MKPATRRRAALALVAVSIVGWPVTALTVARNEPQIVLGLSWLAITISALDVAATADVRTEQDQEDT